VSKKEETIKGVELVYLDVFKVNPTLKSNQSILEGFVLYLYTYFLYIDANKTILIVNISGSKMCLPEN
jgi:hypothetical protein